MKFVAISDTHGCHRALDLPEGDILLHSGDVCDKGNNAQVIDFLQWFEELDFQHKILIRGNHDFDLKNRKSLLDIEMPKGVTQLDHSGCEINGISIWGVPFSFNRNEDKWDSIPDHVHILLTHQPPYSILDFPPNKISRGEKGLLKKVKQTKPHIHLFGHIHASYGKEKIGETTFINASAYKASLQKIINPPVVFNLE